MEMPILYFQKLSVNAFPPEKMTIESAGFDLRSAYDYIVGPYNNQLVNTDLAFKIPDGCYGRIAPRSGLALNHHIGIGAGVIDRDYRGNVGVVLFNHSSVWFEIKKGDRIAQLICERIVEPHLNEVQSLDVTERNHSGFGSTGTQVKMDAVCGTLNEELFSLEDVIKILYILGLTSVAVWEEKLKLIKNNIITCDNFDVLSVYMILTDLSKQIKCALELKYVNSQKDLPLIVNYCFEIEEIYEYLGTHVKNFSLCTIAKPTFAIIKNFITETINNVESIDIDDNNNDDDDDNDDVDDNNEFNEIFTNIKTKKKGDKESFEQSVMFNSNGNRKILKTPGEKGNYLLKIEITDTRDLIGVDPSKRWLQTAYKAVFLTDTKDHNYITLYKMILNISRNLSKIKNISKQTYPKK